MNIMSSQTDRIMTNPVRLFTTGNNFTTGMNVSNQNGTFNPEDPYDTSKSNDESLQIENTAIKRKEELDRTVRTATTNHSNNVFEGYTK